MNPATHFYEKAIRFDEMFRELILPLKENRSHRLTADFAEETTTEFSKREYDSTNAGVILLEGIFLFKQEFLEFFDLEIWVECSFETALKRAISRAPENLPPAETAPAYETVYLPAQQIHFQRDIPRSSADVIFDNNFTDCE